VTAANDGTVFVADEYNQRLQSFGRGGRHLATWGGPSARVPGIPTGRFIPVVIAAGADDTVLVADWLDNLIIQFDLNGQVVRYWGGAGTEPGHFASIAGIDVDLAGQVYVADSRLERVQVFSPEGELVRGFAAGPCTDVAIQDLPARLGLPTPRVFVSGGTVFGVRWFDESGQQLGEVPLGDPLVAGGHSLENVASIATDESLSLYVLDVASDGEERVVELAVDWGLFVGEIAGGPLPDGVFEAAAVTIDPDGRLWVADALGARVQRFDADGRHEATWRLAELDPPIGKPAGVVVANDGSVFVSDRERRRVLRLSADGRLLGTIGGDTGPFGEAGPGALTFPPPISSHPQWVYAADPSNGQVRAFDMNGTPQAVLGGVGEGDGRFCEGCVGDVAEAVNGSIYVLNAASARQRVQVFGPEGDFRFAFDGQLGQDSRLAPLQGVVVAPRGHVFLSDPRARIQAFSIDGQYLGEWDTFDARPDVYVNPADLAADTQDRLFVSDRDGDRVWVFGPERPTAWRGEYFDGSWFSGAPVAIEETATIAFDWTQTPPAPGLSTGSFSARFTHTLELAAGQYRISLEAVGGTRLWVDDRLVIDDAVSFETSHEPELTLAAGPHPFLLEYSAFPGIPSAPTLHLSVTRLGPPVGTPTSETTATPGASPTASPVAPVGRLYLPTAR